MPTMAVNLCVETAFGRHKSINGDSLTIQDDGAQMAEAAMGMKTMNWMSRAAKPNSVPPETRP